MKLISTTNKQHKTQNTKEQKQKQKQKQNQNKKKQNC